MTANEPRFDIFSGTLEEGAVWIETVVGLDRARERMAQMAATKPGSYFVFSFNNNSVVAKLDSPKEQNLQS